ncbi:hypothetical protein CEUSTIGMA_g4533.t1 [Chlamydomonas eustigma]|uniref:Heterokaryon incompatibility domain-containing protein n=1 Tax=Chlamydomonas eustigma TaxID=1157962 RepID=A0A250X1Y2_9CHLO|nr:hypothetical protein CEUSTIGMA_g4533.t1 [Chlamydomonas eustigma]|eukprot:GAX77087.1 hypothetical protein CEUSTIGMA_g4533.t1 [Chlamydomonas eustigma]
MQKKIECWKDRAKAVQAAREKEKTLPVLLEEPSTHDEEVYNQELRLNCRKPLVFWSKSLRTLSPGSGRTGGRPHTTEGVGRSSKLPPSIRDVVMSSSTHLLRRDIMTIEAFNQMNAPPNTDLIALSCLPQAVLTDKEGQRRLSIQKYHNLQRQRGIGPRRSMSPPKSPADNKQRSYSYGTEGLNAQPLRESTEGFLQRLRSPSGTRLLKSSPTVIRGGSSTLLRPQTTGGNMRPQSRSSVDVFLTPESDMFNMASNLGIIPDSSLDRGNKRPSTSPFGAGVNRFIRNNKATPSAPTPLVRKGGLDLELPPAPSVRQRKSNAGGDESPTSTLVRSPTSSRLPSSMSLRLPSSSTVQGSRSSMSGVRQSMSGAHQQTAASLAAEKAAALRAANVFAQPQTLGVSLSMLKRLVGTLSDNSLTSSEVVAELIIPETERLHCRYTDILPDNDGMLAPPQFYISHSWKGNFSEMVEAITNLVSIRVPKISPEDAYVWIDIFCLNMHEPVSPDPNLIREIISSCERTLLILDKDGAAILSTTCLWEIWVSACLDRFDRGRLVVVPSHWSWPSLTSAFSLMDLASSPGPSSLTWGASLGVRERDRRQFLMEMSRYGDLGVLTQDLRDAILIGAKRELQRAETEHNRSPRWFVNAANTAALVLFQRKQYIETDEVLRQVTRTFEKVSGRGIPDLEILLTRLHIALNQAERMDVSEAEGMLQEVLVNCTDTLNNEAIFLGTVNAHALLLCSSPGSFTKGEMITRKNLEDTEKYFGKSHPLYMMGLLQLATVSASQHLVKQSEECARVMLDICMDREPLLAVPIHFIIAALDETRSNSRSLTSAMPQSSLPSSPAKQLVPTKLQPWEKERMSKTKDVVPEQRVVPLLAPDEEVTCREHCIALEDAASAVHVLAHCQWLGNRLPAALRLAEEAVNCRQLIFPESHPSTLESQLLLVNILVAMERLLEAEQKLEVVTKKMVKILGADHPKTLAALGQLADLHRELDHHHQASKVESQILEAGENLVSHNKVMDRVRNVSAICALLATRDRLLEKASLLMAKVLLVYREKVGAEHKLTRLTKAQLIEIVEKEKVLGQRALALGRAGSTDDFKTAEVMFKQAFAVGKMINPNSDHTQVIEGLIEAQFAQGKVHEAQKTLRSSGLELGDAIATSYLRWLNKDQEK